MLVPSEEPTLQEMADMCVAEYLSETREELMSPSGRQPVACIVCQTGDYFNLCFLLDRDGSSTSSHRELLFRCVCVCVCVCMCMCNCESHCNVITRDAPVRHWPIVGRPIVGA